MYLTKEMLDRVIDGKDFTTSLPGPFIVVKSYNKARGIEVAGYEYSVVYNRLAVEDRGGAFTISKNYAKTLIEAFNMKLAMQSPDGRIYEMPGSPFRERFGRNW